MVPLWLTMLAWLCLAAGGVSALAVAADIARHPQQMWIMNVVWPVTALFGPGLMVWMYFRWGRAKAVDAEAQGELPFAVKVIKGALHCGSGCTLGDIAAECLLLAAPGLAVVFGFGWLFGERIFAGWVLDYVAAFIIGIAFQYFTIVPMKKLAPGEGLVAAIRADAASLTAWQVGMYAFMAIAHFWIFGTLMGARLNAAMPEFWFMMQIAMLCGLATSYPVNWWLMKSGLKPAM